MNQSIAGAIVVMLLASPAIAVSVHNDRGGNLAIYRAQRDIWDRRGDQIRISGFCASACTVYISAWRYCVVRDASLKFHRVSSPGGKAMSALTAWLYSQYPFAVRRWIDSRGGLRKNFITLYGRALRRSVRIC